jgi:hypothetical protein
VHFSNTVGITSPPCSSSSQISMLQARMGKPSTCDGSLLFAPCQRPVSTTRGQGRRARQRVVYVHGLLVGDELDPSLDVGHLVSGVWAF